MPAHTVVDDHPAFRKALSSALNLVSDIEALWEHVRVDKWLVTLDLTS